MQPMTDQLREQLWNALHSKTAEIQWGHKNRAGFRREPLYVCADGHSAMVILHVWHRDGSHSVYRIKASKYPNRSLRIDVDVWIGPSDGLDQMRISWPKAVA